MARKSISKKTRFEVFKKDSFTCQYCGSKAPDVVLEIDHINPVFEGGGNNILNLITSCFDCNRGKGKNKISDKSVLHTQVDQLAQLNERRIQIEMLLEWKNGLLEMDNDVAKKISDYFEDLTGYGVSESGIRTLKAIIKKFGYEKAISSMERSVEVYFKNDEKTASICFNKIGAICNLIDKPEYSRKISYIMGILRNKSIYFDKRKMSESLLNAYNNGLELDEFTEVAKSISGWRDFKEKFSNNEIEY